MKIITTRGIFNALVMLAAMLSFGTRQSFSQTNLNFNGVSATEEGAIRLSWNSASNEVYEIDYADGLVDVNDGGTVWNKLYDDYPSHGTNTFWLDTGNYLYTPAILHPKKMPMRFYRITYKATDDTASEPIISITNPTNNSDASGDLTVIVSAQTDQATLSTRLYVDGEAMNFSVDSTNYYDNGTNYLIDTYMINTCEWPNGLHTLFATAKCASDVSGPINASTILLGHSVSSYVPVTFDNLITKYSFSEPFFNPDAGQTQQVSAVFTANCDWTLEIQNASTNTVRYVTGSGSSMLFNWDGMGTNGANLPAGVYTYFLSVQTNGQQMMMSGDGSSSAGLTAFSNFENITELWALPAEGSGSLVPLKLYPPGMDTSSFTIFEASHTEVQALIKAVLALDESAITAKPQKITESKGSGGGIILNGMSGGSGQSSRGPVRPPTKPVNKVAGKFGVVSQDYFPEMLSISAPLNGLSQLHVQIQGSTGSANFPFVEDLEEDHFVATMARGAWQPGFNKKNNQLQASDLKKASLGGANIFNGSDISLGLLSLHGAYGTSPDYNQASGANGATQIYFSVDGRPGASSYVRMSEMDFGSPGTNGLKWMALMACNSLRQQNWNSIRNTGGWKPFNNNLHLLLGANSIVDNGNERMWAKYMLGLDGQTQQTIMEAWSLSGHFCAHRPVTFAVAGYDDCKQDMLTGTNNVTPQGDVFYQSLPTQQ